MERARDKFVIGQLVEVIVLNSTYGMVGKVVAFNEHNEYNVKVAFDDGFKEYFERGYMTNELRAIPRLGHKLSFVEKIKRAYYHWRNSDPVKHCPVFRMRVVLMSMVCFAIFLIVTYITNTWVTIFVHVQVVC